MINGAFFSVVAMQSPASQAFIDIDYSGRTKVRFARGGNTTATLDANPHALRSNFRIFFCISMRDKRVKLGESSPQPLGHVGQGLLAMTLEIMRCALHLDIGLVGCPAVVNDLFGLPDTNLGIGSRVDQ